MKDTRSKKSNTRKTDKKRPYQRPCADSIDIQVPSTRSKGTIPEKIYVFAIHGMHSEDGWAVTGTSPAVAIQNFRKEIHADKGKVHPSETMDSNWEQAHVSTPVKTDGPLTTFMEKFTLCGREYYIELLIREGLSVGWIPAIF